MPNDNDLPQIRTHVFVPLGGTTSNVVSLAGRHILSVEQAPDVQGDRLHLEVSGDGEHFVPVVSVVRPPHRLVLLNVGPVDGHVRLRLDAPQNNDRLFTIISR